MVQRVDPPGRRMASIRSEKCHHSLPAGSKVGKIVCTLIIPFFSIIFRLPLAVHAQSGPQDNWVINFDSGLSVSAGVAALAADSQQIFAATTNDEIRVYSRSGTLEDSWGSTGTGSIQFMGIGGIAVDDVLFAYISDSGNARVHKITQDGDISAGVYGSGTLSNPAGLAIDDTNIFVADSGNDRIYVFTQNNGTSVTNWGGLGTILGSFNDPSYVAVDDAHVFVSDTNNHRIQVFTKAGQFVRSWSVGTNETVQSLAIDNNNVYAVIENPDAGLDALRIFDKNGQLIDGFQESDYPWIQGGALHESQLATHGSEIFVSTDYSLNRIVPIQRIFRTLGDLPHNAIPLVRVVAVEQRLGDPILDIDYVISDDDDGAVTAYAASFLVDSNATPQLDELIPMRTFVDGTSTNVGSNVAVGVTHRLSWDMDTDSVASRVADIGDLRIAVITRDNRELLDLHFLSLPSVDTNAAVEINRAPLFDADFLPAWIWLVASEDSNIEFSNGAVYEAGTGGSVLFAQMTNTTAAGRAFLFDRLNVREATAQELQHAREATTPGTITERDPRRQPPPAGYKVNEFNFVTNPTNGYWVVRLN